MAVIEQEAGIVQGGRRGFRVGWGRAGLAILAVAAVTVTALMMVARTPEPSAPRSEAVVGSRPGSLYTDQELAIMGLVAKGYLPAETLQGEPFLSKRMVNEGLIPPEALQSRSVQVGPLYTARERAVMAAVAQGIVPKEALSGEPFRTKRLVNQGLTPREAARS